MLCVLYDGWSLVYQPGTPAANHLRTILAHLPADIQVCVALPEAGQVDLPDHVEQLIVPKPDTPSGRFSWEQRELPRQLRLRKADLVHLTTSFPPLVADRPVLLSPTTGGELARQPGFMGRLRESFAAGGRARLAGLLWPADLPRLPAWQGRILNLPPVVEPGTASDTHTSDNGKGQVADLDLPETYILCYGLTGEQSIRRLIGAWSWASGTLGRDYPLLAAGLDRAGRNLLASWVEENDLQVSVRILPDFSGPSLRRLVEGCAAFFHPEALAAWGGVMRLAMTCGCPVVALEEPLTAALTGPAAYLIDGGDERQLGAALISVIVESGLAEELGKSARQRASSWSGDDFGQALTAAYRAIAGSG